MFLYADSQNILIDLKMLRMTVVMSKQIHEI